MIREFPLIFVKSWLNATYSALFMTQKYSYFQLSRLLLIWTIQPIPPSLDDRGATGKITSDLEMKWPAWPSIIPVSKTWSHWVLPPPPPLPSNTKLIHDRFICSSDIYNPLHEEGNLRGKSLAQEHNTNTKQGFRPWLLNLWSNHIFQIITPYLG